MIYFSIIVIIKSELIPYKDIFKKNWDNFVYRIDEEGRSMAEMI